MSMVPSLRKRAVLGRASSRREYRHRVEQCQRVPSRYAYRLPAPATVLVSRAARGSPAARRQTALGRRAAIRIETDVVIQRPIARRRRRPREKESAPNFCRRLNGRHGLHHVGIGTFFRPLDLSAPIVAISTLESSRGAMAARIASGSIVGKSPCTFSTASCAPSGSIRHNAS